MRSMLSRAPGLGVLLLASLLTGCATVTGSQTQSISVETRDKAGEFVEGADCQLNNDKGQWSIKTPGSVMVTKSATDLFVRCEKPAQDPGSAVAISRVNPAIFGNIIIGGVIGAIIDHSQGTGYDYPPVLAIEMGSHKTIDLQGGNAVTVSTQPLAPSPGEEKREDGARKTSVTLDELKDLLGPTPQ